MPSQNRMAAIGSGLRANCGWFLERAWTRRLDGLRAPLAEHECLGRQVVSPAPTAAHEVGWLEAGVLVSPLLGTGHRRRLAVGLTCKTDNRNNIEDIERLTINEDCYSPERRTAG